MKASSSRTAQKGTGKERKMVTAVMKKSPSNTNENESPSKGNVSLAKEDVSPSNEDVLSFNKDVTPLNEHYSIE